MESKRRAEYDKMRTGLKKNDRVLTIGGIYGTVTEIEDGETVLLEVAEDLDIRVAKSAISTILTDHSADALEIGDTDSP